MPTRTITSGDTIRHAHFVNMRDGDPGIDIRTTQQVVFDECIFETVYDAVTSNMTQDSRVIFNNCVFGAIPGSNPGSIQGRCFDGVSGHSPGNGIAAFEMYNCVIRGYAGIVLKGMLNGYVRVKGNIAYNINGRGFNGQGGYANIAVVPSTTRQFFMLRRCDDMDAEVDDNLVIQHTLPYYPSQARELIGFYPDVYETKDIFFLGASEDVININAQGKPNKLIQVRNNMIIGSYYLDSDSYSLMSTTGIILDGGGSGNHCDLVEIDGNTVLNTSNVGISADTPRNGGSTLVRINNNITCSSGLLPGFIAQQDGWAGYNKYSSVGLSLQFGFFNGIECENNGTAWMNTRQNRNRPGDYLQKILRKDSNMATHPNFEPGAPGSTNYILPETPPGQVFYRDKEIIYAMAHLNRWNNQGTEVGLKNETVEVEYKRSAQKYPSDDPRFSSINASTFMSVPTRENESITLNSLDPNQEYLFRERKLCTAGASPYSGITQVNVL